MNVSVKDFRMWTKIYFQNFSLTLAISFFKVSSSMYYQIM